MELASQYDERKEGKHAQKCWADGYFVHSHSRLLLCICIGLLAATVNLGDLYPMLVI